MNDYSVLQDYSETIQIGHERARITIRKSTWRDGSRTVYVEGRLGDGIQYAIHVAAKTALGEYLSARNSASLICDVEDAARTIEEIKPGDSYSHMRCAIKRAMLMWRLERGDPSELGEE